MVCLSRAYPLKFFKGCLPQILLGRFLNTLSHLIYSVAWSWQSCDVRHNFSESSEEAECTEKNENKVGVGRNFHCLSLCCYWQIKTDFVSNPELTCQYLFFLLVVPEVRCVAASKNSWFWKIAVFPEGVGACYFSKYWSFLIYWIYTCSFSLGLGWSVSKINQAT